MYARLKVPSYRTLRFVNTFRCASSRCLDLLFISALVRVRGLEPPTKRLKVFCSTN